MVKGSIRNSDGVVIAKNIDIELAERRNDSGLKSWDGYFYPASGAPYIAASGELELVLNNKPAGKMLVRRVRLDSSGRSCVEFQGTGELSR